MLDVVAKIYFAMLRALFVAGVPSDISRRIIAINFRQHRHAQNYPDR